MEVVDHIGTIQIFDGLPYNGPSTKIFQELLYRYLTTTALLAELHTELKYHESDSDDNFDIATKIGFTGQERSNVAIEIELLTTAYYEEIRYDWKAEAVSHDSFSS